MDTHLSYNSTEGGNVSGEERKPERVISLVIIFMLAIIGIVGNGLVLYIFYKVPQLRVTTNVFIGNQSLLDLCASCLRILTFVPEEPNLIGLDQKNRILAGFVCRLWFSEYLYWAVTKASTVNLIFLTVERYVAVVFPLTYRRNARPRVAIILSLFAWIIGALIEIYFPIIHRVFEDGDCSSRAFKSTKPAIAFMELLTTLIVPLSVIIFVYTSIIITVTSAKKKLSERIGKPSNDISTAVSVDNELETVGSATVSSRVLGKTLGGSSEGRDNCKTPRKGKQLGKNKRATTASERLMRNLLVTMFSVCVTYVICWTPNQVLYFRHHFVEKLDWSEPFNTFTILLAFSNVCTNPVIYTLRYKSFQSGLMKVFKR